MSATEQKHTPGPWWTTDSGVRDVGGYICHTNQPTHFQGQDERYDKEAITKSCKRPCLHMELTND